MVNTPKTVDSKPVPRAIATAFFLILIGIPLVYRIKNGFNAADKSTSNLMGKASLSKIDAMKRYGFYLTEISHQAGINFQHQAPQFDAKLDNIMPEIASYGAGVSIVDYNRDGWPDIFVTDSAVDSQCHLYRNNHDGTFADVTRQVGLANLNKPGTGVCMGAVWGDYDNQGYDDLLVYKWGRCMLFHNDAGKRFTDVTAGSGLPQWANITSALWTDFNNDGKLDILLCGYYSSKVDLFHLTSTRIMTNSFEYATNGARMFLLENEGDGHFQDVTSQMGLGGNHWLLASAAGSFCGSNYPDLFLSGDYGASYLYANRNGKGFKDISKHALYSSVNSSYKSGMNASLGDPLNQGQSCIYVSNISEAGEVMQGNNLWVPSPGTSGEDIQYQELGREMGVDIAGWSFGAQFGDLNNSGNEDIILTNGFYSGSPNQSYWYDFSKVTGGNSSIISDAANWPAMRGRSLAGYERKCLWLGDGAGSFREVAQQVGFANRYDGRALVLADLFNDGALDVIVANQRGPLLIYKNTINPENKWIEFHLQGVQSNRSAIGAQITLYWDNKKQLQTIVGGGGFCAENPHRIHYGLGPAPQLQKAVIKWPSGTLQTLSASDLRPDTIMNIMEPTKS